MNRNVDDQHLKIDDAASNGRESIAHINKNPLTNGSRMQATLEERESGHQGRPYQDSGLGGLESSGQMSISLNMS